MWNAKTNLMDAEQFRVLFKSLKEDLGNQMQSLKEDISSQIRTLDVQVQSLKEEVQSVKEEVQSVKEEVKSLKKGHDHFSAILDSQAFHTAVHKALDIALGKSIGRPQFFKGTGPSLHFQNIPTTKEEMEWNVVRKALPIFQEHLPETDMVVVDSQSHGWIYKELD
jgi:seryl-tRNA synthetase